MPSPFPGMNPYLEDPAFWSDFHSTFINYWREAIAELLPGAYEARLGERVYLVEPAQGQRKRIGPDLSVTNGGASTSSTTPAAPSGVLTLTPVTIPLVILEEPRETYIEILHRPDRSLVAVLELLSPANKEEPGRGAYLEKRNAILRQAVHLVSLALLHSGRRLPLRDALTPGDYFAFIARSERRRPDCQIYAWTIRQPLPALPIPLRAPDPDVWINLQAVFALVYERGRYARSLPYDRPPAAPLSADDLTWAHERAQVHKW